MKNRISQDQEVDDRNAGKCAQIFRITQMGKYGEMVELEVFHNHLEFLQILMKSTTMLIHPSEE